MTANKSPIEHIVVLVMENHSYDNMLGYLPAGRGLTGKQFNRLDPLKLKTEKVFVSNDSAYVTSPDPFHDVLSVEKQEYGDVGKIARRARMSGFVKAYTEAAKGDVEVGKKIMQCYDPASVPAITTLAREFALCDRWHASLPGPTMPNRFFIHAATSDGVAGNDATHFYHMKTIFDLLSENGFSWNVYYGDVPQCILVQHKGLANFKMFHELYEDLKKGKLAAYTFIEPRFLDFLSFKSNDQHPPHDVRLGEYLIAEVYEALRSSQFWEKLLLVLLYDEHGGFYDHVPPPGPVPNPDGKVSLDPPFDFTRLGVRVPAILVSPWGERGRVDSTVYEHASLPATVRSVFGLPSALTARDQAARTFERNLTLSAPRSDAPLVLPVPGDADQAHHQRSLLHQEAMAQMLPGAMDLAPESHAPLTLYQQSLVQLADTLNGQTQAVVAPRLVQTMDEHEAAVHVQESVQRYLAGK